MEHDRWTWRAEPVVGRAHRKSVVETLDTRLQSAQCSSYRARGRSGGGALHDRNATTFRSREQHAIRRAQVFQNGFRLVERALPALAVPHRQRLVEHDRVQSRVRVHARYGALGEQRPRECEHERDEEQNAQRQQQPVAQRPFGGALRLARLDEHQRRERMLRRIRARHPVQPDRDTDRQQAEQE